MHDATQAVRSLVLASEAIMSIIAESSGTEERPVPPAEQRVFVDRIPKETIEAADTFHPPKMLVLRTSGGAAKADLLPTEDTVVTALCYGESDFEANRVRRAVWQRFVYLSREKHDDVLIHHINTTGGPVPLVDPDIVWPAVAQSYTVKADVSEEVS